MITAQLPDGRTVLGWRLPGGRIAPLACDTKKEALKEAAVIPGAEVSQYRGVFWYIILPKG